MRATVDGVARRGRGHRARDRSLGLDDDAARRLVDVALDGLEAAIAATLPSIDATVAVGATFYPTMDTEEIRCTTSATWTCRSRSAARAPCSTRSRRAPAVGHRRPCSSGRARRAARTQPRRSRAVDRARDRRRPNCNPVDSEQPGTAGPGGLSDGRPRPAHCLDDVRTIAVLDEAFAAGIPTYVIGMSVTLPLLVDTMNRMAVAGGRPRPGPSSFYAVERPTSSPAFAEMPRSRCVQLRARDADRSVARHRHVDGAPLTRDGPMLVRRTFGHDRADGSGCMRAQRRRRRRLRASVQ